MRTINDRELKALSWLLCSVIGLAFFFMKRSLDKLDSIEQTVIGLGQESVKLKVKICSLEKFLTGTKK